MRRCRLWVSYTFGWTDSPMKIIHPEHRELPSAPTPPVRSGIDKSAPIVDDGVGCTNDTKTMWLSKEDNGTGGERRDTGLAAGVVSA